MSAYPPQNPNFGGFSVAVTVSPNCPPGNFTSNPPEGIFAPNTNFPANMSQYPGSQYPSQTGMSQNSFQPPSGYPSPGVPGYPPQGGDPNFPVCPTPGMPGYPPQGGNPNMPVCPVPGMGVPQPPVSPTAPDLSQMEKIPGYEGLTFEDAVLVPPSFPVWKPEGNEQTPLPTLPSLSEDEVHDAACQYASEHCCYGSKAAREMNLREINMMSAFHYKLDTFTEKRESAWRFEPYKGQAIDGPSNGPAPSPWDVPAVPSQTFVNSKVKMEVPHTAFVKPCHDCVGNTRVRCEECLGNGRKNCTWCKGRGRVTRFDKSEICTSCNGTGFDRCFKCSGTGQIKCKTCDGRGNLKGFVELIVTWVNHSEDFISETSTNKKHKDLVREVTGQIALEEENPRVFPIAHSSDQSVCNASSDLINKHSTAFINERIIKQRHCLRMIPIAHVNYEWKNKIDEFYVYGFEHKVYFRKYPQKCLCAIM